MNGEDDSGILPPQLAKLVVKVDGTADKAEDIIKDTMREIRGELAVLSKELNLATSGNDREKAFKMIRQKMARLEKRLTALQSADLEYAGIAANRQAADDTGVKVEYSQKRADEISSIVSPMQGENLAAVFTEKMEKSIIQELRTATVATMREAAVAGMPMKDMARVLDERWQKAATDGVALKFRDAAGKEWDTRTYMMMNTRTNAMRVYNDNLIDNIARATGSDLVMVSTGGDPHCRQCYPWEGRILSITGKTKGFPTYDEARAAGLFHPNCVHTLEPVDELIDADEINAQKGVPSPDEVEDPLQQAFDLDVETKQREDKITEEEAIIAVKREWLKDAVRNGLPFEGSEAMVDGLSDAEVNALVNNGRVPAFEPTKGTRKNQEPQTFHAGSAGGVVRINRNNLTADALRDIDGLKERLANAESEWEEEKKKLFTADLAKLKPAQDEAAVAKSNVLSLIGNADTLLERARKIVQSHTRIDGKYADAGLGSILAKEIAIKDIAEDVLSKASDISKQLSSRIDDVNLISVPENKEQQESLDKAIEDLVLTGNKATIECEMLIDMIEDGEKKLPVLESDFDACFLKWKADKIARLRKDVEDWGSLWSSADYIGKWNNVINPLLVAAGRRGNGKKGLKRLPELTAYNSAVKSAKDGQKKFDEGYKKSIEFADKGYIDDLVQSHFDLQKLNNDLSGLYDAVEVTGESARIALEKEIADNQAKQNSASATVDNGGKLKPLKHDDGAFPEDIEGLKIVKENIGGTTGAKLVEYNGRRFIMKTAGRVSNDHVRNEAIADQAYRDAGILVPDCKIYTDKNGNTVKLSQFIEGGVSLRDYMKTATPEQQDAIRKQLLKGYPVDALFANWDVLGTDQDNVLVDKDGNAWRIDNGSSFEFRAQGSKKDDDAWKNRQFPDEWRTLRTASINNGVFNGYTAHDIFTASRNIDLEGVVARLPKEQQQALAKPLEEMRQMTVRCADFDRGKYSPESTSEVLEASYDLSKDGFREFCPKRVSASDMGSCRATRGLGLSSPMSSGIKDSDYTGGKISDILTGAAKTINYHSGYNGSGVSDGKPNGYKIDAFNAIDKKKLETLAKTDAGAKYLLGVYEQIEESKKSGWTKPIGLVNSTQIVDSLPQSAQASANQQAGYVSVTDQVHKFIDSHGGNHQLIVDWQAGQGGSSWSAKAVKVKVLEMALRGEDWQNPTTDGDTFFRGSAAMQVAKDYATNPKLFERDKKTLSMWKAGISLFLENSDLEGNDHDARTLFLVRTEDASATVNNPSYNSNGYTFKPNSWVNYPIAPCESSAHGQRTSVYGTETVLCDVPYSRVMGLYYWEREAGTRQCAYLGDGEAEVTADFRGLDRFYTTRCNLSFGEYKKLFDDEARKAGKK